MKKIWLIVILLFIAGCSNDGKSNISENDFFIFHNDTNEKIGLYMERSELENILGSATKDNNILYDYNGIKVGYRDNKVVGISLQGDSAKNYSTSRGIGLGSSKDQLLEVYGHLLKEKDHEEHAVTITITIEEKDGKYEVMGPEGTINHENEDKLYELSFVIDLNKSEVESVSIWDYVFATRFK